MPKRIDRSSLSAKQRLEYDRRNLGETSPELDDTPKPVAQRQGGQVAWLLCNGDEQAIDSTIRWDVAKNWPEYAAPLFTHADPAEVERLREAVNLLSMLRGMIYCTPENDEVKSGSWISTKHPTIQRIDALLSARVEPGVKS